MKRQQNTPDFSFVIDARNSEDELLFTWRLDQVIPLPKRETEEDRLTNQVQEYLHDMSKRTGLQYLISAMGTPEWVDVYLKVFEVEITPHDK